MVNLTADFQFQLTIKSATSNCQMSICQRQQHAHINILFISTACEVFKAREIEFINRMHCFYTILFHLPFDMYTIHRFCHAVCFISIGVVPVERNHKISAHIKCSYDCKGVSHFTKVLYSLCDSDNSLFHFQFL